MGNPKFKKEKNNQGKLREETVETIKSFGIIPDKDLGQNFLVDENVLDEIARSADISPEDFVMEIGPGLGALTEKIHEKSGKLILIEYDSFLVSILENKFKENDNIVILNEDALQTDYAALIDKYTGEYKNPEIKILSNLPYYITTEIITKLVCEIPHCKSMVFTIQREAAEKISSAPGSKIFSIISALVSFYFEPEIIQDVPPESFIPKPGVNSSVLILKRRQDLPDDGITPIQYLKVLKAAFSKRRKTIANSLGSSGIVEGGKTQVEKIMSDLGLSANTRAQEISPEDYRKIAKIIFQKKNSSKTVKQ